jgi:putative FmdB family regulatory protein
MPIYEYACESCGRVTEVIQRLDEAPLAACPECGGAVKKLLSAPAFQFKGEGWYVTDYARKGGGKGESAKGGTTKSEASSTSDTAPASAKSEATTKGGADSAKPANKD